MIVGVTGTRAAKYGECWFKVARALLRECDPKTDTLVIGGCIGADTIAGVEWRFYGGKLHVVLPANLGMVDLRWNGRYRLAPEDDRYSVERMPEATNFLDRDQQIVDLVEKLIAFPKTGEEERRSGTWATIRMARKKGIPVTIVPLGIGG